MEKQANIRVYIADDHQLIIDGLKLLLLQSNKFQIIGEALEGIKAEEDILRLEPDIVLLDLKMPGKDGLQVIQALNKQHCPSKIIVLSMHEDIRVIKDAAKFGAKAYVLKNIGRTELFEVINSVLDGKTHFHVVPHTGHNEEIFFTPRERDVLKLIIKGKTTIEISHELHTSEATIKVHRRNIREKTGATNTVELIKILNDLNYEL
jgi:two-component system, NarL family, nitrate/nitrite response regulator NarL